MNKKLLIFDFDGTIADSRQIVFETVNQLSKKYGYRQVRKEDIEKLRDKTIRELFQVLGISWMKLPLLVVEYRKKYSKIIPSIKTIRGIKEVLVHLHNNGYMLAIVTSNSKENVKAFLQRNTIDIFDEIGAGVSLFGKARLLSNLLKKYKFDPADALYIGDEVRDIEAAQKIGLELIAVTWGFQSRKVLEKYKPNYIVDTPQQLFVLLYNKRKV